MMRLLAICLIAFGFGFFGSMPIAGPVSVLVLARAARGRFREALHIGLGAAAAEAIYAGAAYWGFTTIFARYRIVVPLSHAAAAVVLVGLGLRFVVWSPTEPKDAHERRAGTALLGFTVSALNPTLLVTWGAVTAFLFSKGLRASSQLYGLPFGACAGAGIAAWFAALVALLRKYQGKVPRTLLTWTVRVLGLVLVGLGLWSGVQLGQWLAVNSSFLSEDPRR